MTDSTLDDGPTGSTQLDDRTLSLLLREAVAHQALISLTSGTFLVAFALRLDASNSYVGWLAALPLLAQALQLPAVLLYNRLGRRKNLVLGATFLARVSWVPIALVPFLSAPSGRAVLLAALSLGSIALAIAGCGWSAWLRDIVPDNRRGAFSSRRLALTKGLGIGLALVGALLVDVWDARFEDLGAYSLLFGFAIAMGLLSVFFMSKIREPAVTHSIRRLDLDELLEPVRQENFRNLLIFLGLWSFAANLAAPFYTVYLIQRLDMNLASVLLFASLANVMNMAFFGLWGRFADRFSNKTVLRISAPLCVACTLAWTFTTLPHKHALTIPLLIAIYALLGIATAGVMVATANIGMKLSPWGRSTHYLAASTFVTALAAGTAPILGGRFADFFAQRELAMSWTWKGPSGELVLEALNIQSWDFFFLFAFLIGLYSLRRLIAVREEGDVQRREALREMFGQLRRDVSGMTTIGVIRTLIFAPWRDLAGPDDDERTDETERDMEPS